MTVYYRYLKAGDTATKSALDDREPLSVVKTADEAITSTTTVQADNHLLLALAANCLYHVSLVVIVSGPQAADYKHQWSVPSGATGRRFAQGPKTNTTTVRVTEIETQSALLTTAIAYGTDGSDNSLIREEVLVSTSGTAGNLTLMWAQNVSNASATTVRIGSWMSAQRVV